MYLLPHVAIYKQPQTVSTASHPCFIDELGLNLPDLILISLKNGWNDIQSFPSCLSQEQNGDNFASENKTLLISLKPATPLRR